MIFSLFALLLLGGLVYAGVSGARSLFSTEPVDVAEVFKSAAMHGALFLSFVCIAVGVIDLLQFVFAGDSLAGTNSDLARAMSLLIVAVPTFGLLLRSILRSSAEKQATGNERAGLGWSVYLVAALSVSLVGVMVSVFQITDDLFSDFRDVDGEEVAQLIGWLVLWALHWFALRPRIGIRGDLHLAIGTVAGLSWILVGVGALVGQVLERGYSAAFDESLAGSAEILQWIVVALVGGLVWGFHWMRFNTAGSVEGDRRRSPMWYAVVVLAGILPGLVAMLVSGTAMVAGVLVWFFGNVNESAVDYFGAAPTLVTMFVIGFVLWAYHRWELDSDGDVGRNEVLRLNDYLVVGIALISVVGAIAWLFSLVFEAITVGDSMAGGLDVTNSLIIIVVGLITSSALWWRVWDRIERWRHARPFDESDSMWRKMYLVTAFGLGGLVLAVSLIWLLFSFLRDLFDGQLGATTLQDVSAPIGWSVAVIGAVWYHLGVWRADRHTLGSRAPAPPEPGWAVATAMPAPASPPSRPPAAGVAAPAAAVATVPAAAVHAATTAAAAAPAPAMAPAAAVPAVASATPGLSLRSATVEDRGEIFSLQRAAFVDEAVAYGTPDVPALTESYEEFAARLDESATIVAVDSGRIVGSVCLHHKDSGGVRIERMMVAPDRRRESIATMLLDELEGSLAQGGEKSVQLVVGEIVPAARSLYVERGYTLTSRDQAEGGPVLLTMTKLLAAG